MSDQPYWNQPNQDNQQGTGQPGRGRQEDPQEIPGRHPGFRPLSGHQPDRPAPISKVAGFQPAVSNQRTLSWFDQSLLEEMVSYSDKDGFRVYITREALAALRQGTQQRVPREAFGVLMGRAYQGSKGVPFTVVTCAVYAQQLDASEGHVRLTAEQMRELRRAASAAHPDAEFVGWTHSHSSLSNYSPVDLEEQRNWPEEHNVGILTFMDGSRFPAVYRGPFAHRLAIEKAPPLVKGETPRAADSGEGQAHDLTPANSKVGIARNGKEENQPINWQKRSRRPNRSSDLAVIVLAIWQVLLTIGLVTAFFLFDRDVLALRSELAAPAPSNLIWGCTPGEGSVPLEVICNGPEGPGITNWLWDFGDGNMMTGRSVTHTYQHPGTFTLNLKVITSSLTQKAGSVKIRVDAPPKKRVRSVWLEAAASGMFLMLTPSIAVQSVNTPLARFS